jgi:hypothetical protein
MKPEEEEFMHRFVAATEGLLEQYGAAMSLAREAVPIALEFAYSPGTDILAITGVAGGSALRVDLRLYPMRWREDSPPQLRRLLHAALDVGRTFAAQQFELERARAEGKVN